MSAQLDMPLPMLRVPRRGIVPGSQNDLILRYLQDGKTLTPLQALTLFDCLRLAGRVGELRDLGYDIKTDIIQLPNGKRIAEYRLGSGFA